MRREGVCGTFMCEQVDTRETATRSMYGPNRPVPQSTTTASRLAPMLLCIVIAKAKTMGKQSILSLESSPCSMERMAEWTKGSSVTSPSGSTSTWGKAICRCVGLTARSNACRPDGLHRTNGTPLG